MLKIHIIGGPGSGKTTLAQHLAARFHIPHYDLDQLTWKHGMAPLAAYVQEALTVLEQPSWITEGIYLLWTDPLLAEADYIIILDIPFSLAVWRVLYRHVSKSIRGTNPYATKWLWPLFKGMRSRYNNTDTPPTEFVRTYLEKYRELTKPPVNGFSAEFASWYLATYQDMSNPPDEEFTARYLEKYPEGSEPPVREFLRMHQEKFRATIEPQISKAFIRKYLDLYKEKVITVKSKADRERLLELLVLTDQKLTDLKR